MTPQAVKTAISTVPIKLTAHAIGCLVLALACQTPFCSEGGALDSATAAVSILSALSTRLLTAPITILSAMTPQAVKARAISTVLSTSSQPAHWLVQCQLLSTLADASSNRTQRCVAGCTGRDDATLNDPPTAEAAHKAGLSTG